MSSGDDFGRAVARVGVAQICEGMGFHAIQRSASEALADIALRYLSDLARAAHYYANLAGRTECNALDAVAALEDVSGAGRSGASDSRALHDFVRYVEYSDEVPFLRPLPRFPVPRRPGATGPRSFAQLGETPPHAHIPAWLPAFPDAHTYRATPVWDERRRDPRVDKLELTRQRRKAERSLVSLQIHLASGGSQVSEEGVARQKSGAFPATLSSPSRRHWASMDEQAALLSKLESEGGKSKGKRAASAALQNPFLASPLPASEREVSAIPFSRGQGSEVALQIREAEGGPVALPSVLDTFSAAIESAKHATVHNADPRGSGEAVAGAEDRRPVFLSFDWSRSTRRKVLSAQLSLGGLFNRSPDKNPAKEEEKDDRKRRAEQILARSYDESVEDASQP